MPANIIGPLITGGANFASSVLGYLGQKSANKTNYRIAQETNANNMAMAREANAQNYKIFQEQLKYNSPEEQRRMLEEAGYNPASLTDTGSHTPVVSSPQMQVGNPAVPAHMGNELAYFNQLGEISNNVAALAQAKKANAEAKGQEIQNEYTRQQLETMLQGLGLDNKMKELDYKFSNDSFEQRLQRLYHDTDIALEQKNELHMRNALLEVYGEKDIKSKIDLAVATAEKARAEGKQALSQADLNKILGETSKAQARYYDVQSWYQQNILDSERERNYKTARAMDATAVNLDSATKVYKAFGMAEKGAQILKTLKEMDFTDAAIEKVWKENKVLQKDIDWYEFKSGCDALKILSNTALGGFFMLK